MTTCAKFVVLEGCDGAGTTTQREALAATLRARGHDVHTTAEPSGGPVGRLIRARLSGSMPTELEKRSLALLFAADRLQHLDDEVRPRLRAGNWVISDRYVLSSWVYQGLDCPLDWVRQINRFADAPDLTVLVEVSPETAKARRDARRGPGEIFDDEQTQRTLVQRYSELAHELAAERVSGEGAPDEVTASIVARLSARGWVRQ